jgi:hypothetical protein
MQRRVMLIKYPQHVCTFMIYPHTKFHMHGLNNSLVITGEGEGQVPVLN